METFNQKSTELNIIQLGNPVLRKKAKEVANIKNAHFQKLIDDLIKLVIKVDGVGIAAPQVNKSLKLFIIASHPNKRYPNAPDMEPTAVINPRILFLKGKKVKDWEGCLSVPGIRALVARYEVVDVEYVNREGLRQRQTFTDFPARIFQHEFDHLEGIVFLDRVEDKKEIITEKEYQKLISEK